MTSTSTVALEESAAQEKAKRFEELERQKMERKIAQLQAKLGAVAEPKPAEPSAKDQRIAELEAQLAAQKAASAPQVREGIQFGEGTNISKTAAQTADFDDQALNDIWDGGEATVVGKVGQTQSVEESVEESAEEIVEDKSARLAFAKQMMPNFDWDFSVNWKRKLKLLEESGNPLLICTVYAVESQAMKGHIAEKFPQYNLGA